MCNYCLFPPLWLLHWGLGWATGWQMGLVRTTSSLSQMPTLRIRTPLLRLHVGTLKPRPNAGQSKPYAMKGGPLRLVSHD